MSEKKTLVRFNIQNLKFATMGADGAYGVPVPYGTAIKMALEADSSSKKIFGDGKSICVIVNEKGKTGTMTTNNISNEYEIAMGRKIQTGEGLADIKQQKNIVHAIYFETCGLNEDGVTIVEKTWLYGVTSSRPSESFDQNTDDINESSFDTALEIKGTPLMDANDKKHKDDKGNEIIVWQMTVKPGDKGYDTFGESVVMPKMSAQAQEAGA